MSSDSCHTLTPRSGGAVGTYQASSAGATSGAGLSARMGRVLILHPSAVAGWLGNTNRRVASGVNCHRSPFDQTLGG